LRELPHKI
jgi:hypothetical protein